MDTMRCFLPHASRLAILAVLSVCASFCSSSASGLGVPRIRTHSTRPVLVGYFPQWGIYYDQPYYVKSLVTSGSVAHLNQINYAQGFVTGGRCSLADPKADLNLPFTADTSVDGVGDAPNSTFRGNFHQLLKLKHRFPRMKVLISLEGKAADFAWDAQPENRRAFVASCIDTYIRGNFAPGVVQPGVFDGFDVDWESPQAADAANFRALLEEFRRQMDAVRPGLRLSIAVGESPAMLPGTDFVAVSRLVDQVGVMNYDYAGPWSQTTGFLAPLFADHHSGSIESSLAHYKAAGVPASKLLMGLPFYGYSWTAVPGANNGLFQHGQAVHADRPYNYIRTLTSFATYRDPRSQAPWRFDGQTFWTYEDPVSLRYKASYARREHLAGVMIWELSNDTLDAELLKATWQSLHHPLKQKVFEAVVTPDLNSAGS